MGILFSAFQTQNGSNGGMESATRIYEALSSEYQWLLLTNRETNRTSRWRQNGAQVFNFSFSETSPRLERARQSINMYLRFAKVIRYTRPAIIHANDIRTARVMLPLAKMHKIPFLYTMRDTKPPGADYDRTWKRVCKNANQIVTLSEEMSEFAINEFGAARDRLISVNSIVDLEEFFPLVPLQKARVREGFGLRRDEVAIGIVGVVSEKKGQLKFIENAWRRIRVMNSMARLHLIGDHRPNEDRYCALTQQVADEVGGVSFHGLSSQVPEWLQSLDLVVVSSQNEGLARCMIESMASGVPVVSFDVCSAREMLLESGAGVVVPLGDYETLAQTVVELSLNEEKLFYMGLCGRSLAEARFSSDRIEAEWHNVYSQLLGEASLKTGAFI